MSTTTVPAAVIDAAHAYTEKGLPGKQAMAVAMRDAGYTNEQGGQAFAEVFTTGAIKSGGFGNLVVNGMRALGRESEIASPMSGGGRTRKARTPVEAMQDELDRVRETLDNLGRPVREAKDAIKALDAETLVASKVEEITAKIEALKAEAKAIKANPQDVIDAETSRLQTRLDAATSRMAERETELRTTEGEFVAVLKTLGA